MIQFLLHLIVNGLILGIIYALVAVGLALIFGVLEIVNFANGELYMIGGYATYFFVASIGANYWVAVIGTIIIVALVGALLYDTVLVTVRSHDFQKGILLTIGISMILQNGAIFAFTATPRMLISGLQLGHISIFGMHFSGARLLPVLFAAVAFTWLYWFLKCTRYGKAMRALAQNRDAALIVGLRPRVLGRLALMIGSGLCGLAGAALAPVYAVDPLMGMPMLFKAFAIIIVGGLGSIPGAVVAALLIGVTESLAGGFGSTVMQDATAFILMTLVLLFYPLGLFGRGVRV